MPTLPTTLLFRIARTVTRYRLTGGIRYPCCVDRFALLTFPQRFPVTTVVVGLRAVVAFT